MMHIFFSGVVVAAAFFTTAAFAQQSDRSPEQWILLGETVHGGFGSHIALGIRIGEDALRRLGAGRREVSVAVVEGANAPCACVADGVMLATSASPGQKTLVMLPKSADVSYMVQIAISSKAGKTLTYQVPASAIVPLAQMNPNKTSREKFDLVYGTPATALFAVTSEQ